MHSIFIMSDGTGKTAEMALNAALTQFAGVSIQIIRRPGIKSFAQIENIVDEAKIANGFIIHTLVSDRMRTYLVKLGRLNNVETIDIMGPLLSRLSNLMSVSPSQQPGLFNHLNEEYFRRLESMNFAFKHDDGQRVDELVKAEIILVGVSRTFKTPLSIYLAFKGWLVANVPVVLSIPYPSELDIVDPQRVFYLTTNPQRLSELRRVRSQKFGHVTQKYASLDFVRLELQYGLDIFKAHPGWSSINVTSKSIEEIASEIISLKRESE